MSSIIDTVVAMGIIVVAVAFIISLVLNFFLNISALSISSELTTLGLTISNTILGSKGVPSNWENYNFTPTIIGLQMDLNRIPIVIGETNGSSQNNLTVNVTIQFDSGCQNKTWETSVRIFDSNNSERPFSFYNKTTCNSRFLNRSDVVFNVTLVPNDIQTFFLYFSADDDINQTAYPTISFPPVIANVSRNVSAIVYPTETFKSISPGKLRALRRLPYRDVLQIIGLGSDFKLEVTER
jgi:hypothetical protein